MSDPPAGGVPLEGTAVAAAPRRRGRWLSLVAKTTLSAVAFLILAAAAIGLLLDTDLGHRLILDRIAAIAPDNGLRIRIGRIEGSIWGRTELRDVRLYDPEGLFAEAPAMEVEWQPLAWLADRLLVDEVETELAILHRLPRLLDDDDPVIPRYDISVGRFEIAQLRLDEAVAGERRIARVGGELELRRGRALLDLEASLKGGGDRLTLLLDAAPDRDRFDLDMQVEAPTDGVFGRMLGIREPIHLEVSGDGGWRQWRGAARLDVSRRRAADLRLAAAAGRYGAHGWVAPSPIFTGRMAAMAGPRMAVSASARFDEGVLDGAFSGRSEALRLVVRGAADLRRNRYRDLRVHAELLRPAELLQDVRATGARMTALLDGPFADGAIAYQLSAERLAFGSAAFEQVRASGSGRWARGRVAVPVTASARRAAGFGERADAVLANLRLTGSVLVEADRLSAPNLAIVSNGLRGRLGLRADLANGRHAFDGTASMEGYPLTGLGLVDLRVDLRGASAPGGTTIGGTARAAFRRLDNAALRWAAQGPPRFETAIAGGPDGLRFPDFRFASPALQLSGAGIERPDGSLSFEGSGRHRSLGPLTLRIERLGERPRIAVRLARPWPTLALSGVTIQLDPQASGFLYEALGGSALGPFRSRGVITTPPGHAPMLRVAAFDLSGAAATGTLRPGRGGVAGQLDFRGALAGPVLFTLPGGGQRIEARLVATDAQLGRIPLGSGRLGATVDSRPGGELSGAIRFDGAADRLWSLAGPDQVRLGGPIRLRAQLGGTVNDPELRGSLRLSGGRLAGSATGTVIEAIESEGSFDASRLSLTSFSGNVGQSGRISGRGTILFGGGLDLRLEAQRAQLLARPDLRARLSGRVAIRSDGAGGGTISGDLRMVDGLIRTGRGRGGSSAVEDRGSGWRLALRIAGDDLEILGGGLESEWRTDLRVAGTVDRPRITGEAELVRGRYVLLGRPFELSRGRMRFDGESPPDPLLDLVARSGGSGPGATVRITGRASRPVIGVVTPLSSLPEPQRGFPDAPEHALPARPARRAAALRRDQLE